MESTLIIFIGLALLIFIQLTFAAARYKRVPPNKILVIFGKVSEDPNEKYKILTSGSAFVWPVLQDYFYLDATHRDLLIEESFSTKDQQNVMVRVALNYRLSKQEELVEKAVNTFYQKDEEAIKDMIREEVKRRINKEMMSKTKSQLAADKAAWIVELEEGMAHQLSRMGVESKSLFKLTL